MTNLQLPAHILARANRGVAATLAANLASGAPPHLSIKGSRFTLVDAAGNQRPINALELNVVIADMNPHVSKIYYENAYDPNASESLPPTCFSDNGEAPSASAQRPQSKTCSGCPHNVWGSDVSKMTGKATKACNDVQKLAILIPGDPQAIVYLLRVPPASLKHLGKYAREVGAFSSGGRTVDVSDLVTKLTFDPSAVGILNFAPVEFVSEEMVVAVEKAIENKSTRLVTGADDRPHQGQLPDYSQATHSPAVERQLPPPPAPAQAQPVFPVGNGVAQPPMTAGETPPKPRGRGRPKKEEQAAPPTQAPFVQAQPTSPFAPGGPAVEQEELAIPPFLQRSMEPAAPPKPTQFGITEAEDVPDEMQARLDSIFKLPT